MEEVAEQESGTDATTDESGQRRRETPKERALTGAPDGMRSAADGADGLTRGEEREALEWLLSPSPGPILHKVAVKVATPMGDKTIMWHINQLDGRVIEKIEDDSRKGEGPFAEVDDMRANERIVARATVFPDVSGPAFRTPPPTEANPAPTPDADPADAIARVFRYQSGILAGLAAEVRRISGWTNDRVGRAERVLIDATGNSSG